MRKFFLNRTGTRTVFTRIYKKHLWKNRESLSGEGSTIHSTEQLRSRLPGILKKYDIKNVMDAGCGDFNWMRTVNLAHVQYTGMDVVEEVIAQNTKKYGTHNKIFLAGDVVNETPNCFDLIICRDCLVHLPVRMARGMLVNFCLSGSKYLLTTTYPEIDQNFEVAIGQWFPYNLQIAPFNLPKPLELMEDSAGPFPRKHIGLWRISDLPFSCQHDQIRAEMNS
jgi:SAM-dependent methyltransferase